ncbi:hypothetical protein LLG95_05395 [bacterium]|nr:hypothetical protein [bacterium]
MRAIVYGRPLHDKMRGSGPLSALAEGMQKAGWQTVWRNPNVFTPDQTEQCDAVVIHGLHGHARMIRDSYAAHSIPILILEYGYWRRDEGYWSLGIGNLNWIPQTNCPDGRAKALGLIAPPTCKSEGEYILLCGQKSGDAQHDIQDIALWARETAARIHEHTDVPIVWRPHPRQEETPAPSGTTTHLPSEFPLEKSLAGAKVLVTHNSTAAYAAFVTGIPVVCDRSAAYAEVANVDLGPVIFERPGAENIQAFLNRVAYAQWNLSELSDGTAFSFYNRFLSEKKAAPVMPTPREMQTMRGRLGLLEQEAAKLGSQNEQLLATIQRLETEKTELKTRLENVNARAGQLEAENAALKSQNQDGTVRQKGRAR